MMDPGCLECSRVKNITAEKHCLTVDVPSSVVCFPLESQKKQAWKNDKKKVWKADRDTFVLNLKKYICALRNSGGGVVLVHIQHLDTSDRYLDYFHELVDERLNGMIEDGSLFVTVYKKDWFSKSRGNNGFVCITVSPSVSVVTLDFKTKLPLDNCIVDPSSIAIVKLLTQEFVFYKKAANIRGPPDFSLTECRNLQVKVITESERHLQNVSEFVDYVWLDLRLREYVTAFSKIDGGGSFYAGIEEKEKIYSDYISKELNRKGFIFTASQTEFTDKLKDRVRSEILVFARKEGLLAQVNELLENLIEVAFHPVDKDRNQYILEVAVSAVEGIVFYDKSGPESYKLDDKGNMVPLELLDWYKRQTRVTDD